MQRRRGSSAWQGPGRFAAFKKQYPEASFWITAGLKPQSALALARAGFLSLRDLRGLTLEDLLAIPGVGVATLAALEELLGGEARPPRPSGIPRLPYPEEVWRLRGLPPQAAITFAQTGMTLERLEGMTREDLLDFRGMGPKALRACERLLGREIPSRKPADPVVSFWRSRGVAARVAKALSKAGIGSLEDLAQRSREEIVTLRGVGEAGLRRLEAVAGREIPSRTAYWLQRGLSAWLANALVRAGLHSLEAIERLTREEFLAKPGLGTVSLGHCERLLKSTLPSRRREP
jgi:hypothetical protein